MERTLRVVAVAGIVALATAACSGSSPTSPSLAPGGAGGVLAQGGIRTVPLKGRMEGTVVITPTPPFPPASATVEISASGNATHLGRFTVQIPHVVDFATATGVGTFTFTAANGDLLTATFTGQADTSQPIFSIEEHATITGGTGRFAGATGSFVVQRLFDPVALTTTGSFEGTITLD
jgi:hypothetical protein